MLSYENCTLCPRECGVNRVLGERGFCSMPAAARVARAMLHEGEEPLLTGGGKAGAVFFGGCTLRCTYCQNSAISRGGGKAVSAAQLRECFEGLLAAGARCIDLVTPTHFLPDILPALTPKLPVPVVYNCGGYERVETIRALEGAVDVWLPDLKYADGALAARLSRAADYFAAATAAIMQMYRQCGPAVVEDGQLRRGVLIRHLVLPGYLDNTLRVIEWVGEQFPHGEVLFSLMRQYVPFGNQSAPLDRRVTDEEYAGAVSWLELCGVRNGYLQDATAATDALVPDFNTGNI